MGRIKEINCCVIVQPVSHLLPTAAARVRSVRAFTKQRLVEADREDLVWSDM
jgi:hypothetical protein